MVLNCNDLSEEENQFIKFIESFSDYYKPAYTVSDNILPTDKGRNMFDLYSLDDICQSIEMKENGTAYNPKTTDAIFFKKPEDGRFTIFLIEFKGDNITNFSTKLRLCDYIQKLMEMKKNLYSKHEKDILQKDINDLKKILMKYSDSMLNSLILKPIETVTVSLPLIYESYYEKNKDNDDIKHFDINNFLRKSRIVYKVVCHSDTENPYRERSAAYRSGNYSNDLKTLGCKKFLEEQSEIELTNELTENYQDNLNTFYIRYTKAKIIDTPEYDYFISARQFNNYFKKHCL